MPPEKDEPETPGEIVGIRVDYKETKLQSEYKKEGAKWDPAGLRSITVDDYCRSGWGHISSLGKRGAAGECRVETGPGLHQSLTPRSRTGKRAQDASIPRFRAMWEKSFS